MIQFVLLSLVKNKKKNRKKNKYKIVLRFYKISFVRIPKSRWCIYGVGGFHASAFFIPHSGDLIYFAFSLKNKKSNKKKTKKITVIKNHKLTARVVFGWIRVIRREKNISAAGAARVP